ncbi:DMT family transporter [Furfurilactobacillus siliginis]|uniref:Membrane protein n=1 Tax=Furfurilactobacillus siliginis TaxID=348151 RepID=A0A0R2LEG8_9LACO|nr:DMT family transporter [Furfurilactobacillus siliginis]KRN96941.1 transport protein [Furfurilactobacillus siliginis]GEK27700.1 membrane protein [Furfurilactobacillus siliginis]
MNSQTNYSKGIFWAAFASTMWGISGTILQYISQTQNIPATWFLSVRTLGAGIILLVIGLFREGTHIFDLFKSWRLVGWLVAYSLLGLMANLFTFYMSIKTGNAAVATILQYLSPLFIVLGALVFKKQIPLRSDLIAFGVALVGVFLAITRGNIHTLSVPVASLIWGALSGVTAACYVVLPRPIVEKHSPIVVLGWGMLISGVLFNLWHPIWVDTPPINGRLVIAILSVILIGTVLAFSTLLYSLNFAPSSAISIVDAVQPVVTFILSIIFFHLQISLVEVIGSVLVIVAVYLLQALRKRPTDD